TRARQSPLSWHRTFRKYKDVSPYTHNIDVTKVSRTVNQLVNMKDGIDEVSKDDVKDPEGDIGDEIQTQFDAGKDLYCTITAFVGEEICIAVKEAPKCEQHTICGINQSTLLPKVSIIDKRMLDLVYGST
ncbi:hypothetical protein PSHT_10193, partial [Puccinia striiformis]